MLKSNSKKVRARIYEDIIEHYEERGLAGLLEDYEEYKDYFGLKAGDFMVEHGKFRIYYDDIRQYLKSIMEETDEEAARFTDADVWGFYKYLVSREIKRLYDLEKELYNHLTAKTGKKWGDGCISINYYYKNRKIYEDPFHLDDEEEDRAVEWIHYYNDLKTMLDDESNAGLKLIIIESILY